MTDRDAEVIRVVLNLMRSDLQIMADVSRAAVAQGFNEKEVRAAISKIMRAAE